MLSYLRKPKPRGLAVLWVSLAALFTTPLPAADPGQRDAPPRQGSRPGRSVSTLDPGLQDTAARLLREARPVAGGIVAVHAPTGRVLALKEFHRTGPNQHPLTRAVTPAASLFKIVTSVALFERAGLSPRARVCISGGERAIERVHLSPPPARDPKASCRPFEEALGFSRNAAFAQLATQHLLHADLLAVAEHLGFNRPLPFDTKAEMGTLAVPYDDLEFARTAAGFRGSRLSVLGAAHLAYAVAAGGVPRRMTLRASPDTLVSEPADADAAVMSRRTAQRIRRMMEVTIHSGTSLEAFSQENGFSYLGGIRAAGKTGTLARRGRSTTTSWFIGFAPSRAPELVVSVMLDNSPVWRRKANHVARDLMRAYFDGRSGVTHPFPASPHVAATASARAP